MSLMNLFVAARSAWRGIASSGAPTDELMALDDRSLADIGIHRSQIHGLVVRHRRVGPHGDDAGRRRRLGFRPRRTASRHRTILDAAGLTSIKPLPND